MKFRGLHALACLLCVTATMPCVAQALTDPTRPPNGLGLPSEGSGGTALATTSTPVLQSILLGPKQRLAWIDGRSVKVGDRVGEARVVAIDADSVKLRGDKGVVIVMKLMPEVLISKSIPSARFAESPAAYGGETR